VGAHLNYGVVQQAKRGRLGILKMIPLYGLIPYIVRINGLALQSQPHILSR